MKQINFHIATPVDELNSGPFLQAKLSGWQQDIELVEQRMYTICARPAQNKQILRALRHHLTSGGGRTRSKLALTAAYSLGLSQHDAIVLATSVELLHNASLVQDDLQDAAEIRRGQLTVWKSYGINTALGLTDLMITASFAAIAQISKVDKLPYLIQHLHDAVANTIHGQSYDVVHHNVNQLGSGLCLQVAEAKSGPLFSLGLELPLIVAGYQDSVAHARRAARTFGTGYQIIDDIFDRDEDRQQGSIANVLFALELEVGASNALEAAMDMAQDHLESATALGKELPNQCGFLLEDLAEQLLHKLERKNHA
ncbi:MAG: polyprenyl synthetase family protein [Gammaproteobacteria bacterium]|nr:polyprenyl synthetase family protein [Gammaproteobacteria bacterium]